MKRTRLPRYVQRHRAGFRGRVSIDGVQHVTPVYDDPWQAHSAALLLQRERDVPVIDLESWTLVNAYNQVLSRVERTRSPGHVAWFKCQGTALFVYFEAQAPLHSLTHRVLQRFINERAQQTSAATAAHHYRALSMIFRHAIKNGWAGENPLTKVDLPRARKKAMDFFEPAELGKIVQRIEESGKPNARRDADLVLFLFYTGLRRTEAARVKVEDINLRSRIIHVEGKRGERTVTVADELMPVLRRLKGLKKRGVLFSDRPDYISLRLRRWSQRLNVPRLHAHALRHSFVFMLVDQLKLPINQVMDLAGHQRIETTQKYFHVKSSHRRRALRELRLPRPASGGSG